MYGFENCSQKQFLILTFDLLTSFQQNNFITWLNFVIGSKLNGNIFDFDSIINSFILKCTSYIIYLFVCRLAVNRIVIVLLRIVWNYYNLFW